MTNGSGDTEAAIPKTEINEADFQASIVWRLAR
jgi:hypothetical protein